MELDGVLSAEVDSIDFTRDREESFLLNLMSFRLGSRVEIGSVLEASEVDVIDLRKREISVKRSSDGDVFFRLVGGLESDDASLS